MHQGLQQGFIMMGSLHFNTQPRTWVARSKGTSCSVSRCRLLPPPFSERPCVSPDCPEVLASEQLNGGGAAGLLLCGGGYKWIGK
jgi:hypothetical protein